MWREGVTKALAAALLLCAVGWADIPLVINHQGIVKVNGQPFTGNGLFKFGFVDTSGNWLWTNDGTRIGENADVAFPSAAVITTVTNGIYNVRLGDTGAGNMVPIPSSVFDSDDVRLRIIFNDGSSGEQALLPDQPITSGAYAYHARNADLLGGHDASELNDVPSGYMILGDTLTAPPGYTYTGTTLGKAWSTKAPIPTGRSGAAIGVIGGVIYVAGGYSWSLGSATDLVDAYDPATDTWTGKAPMPTARTYAGCAVTGSKLYVFGGNNPTLLTANECYDPASNTWTPKADMLSARQTLAGAAVNGKVYAIGGESDLTANHAYDPVGNAWSVKEPMPTGRYYLTTVAVDDTIYAIGGRDGAGDRKTVEAYNPQTNSWSVKANAPSTLVQHASVAVGTTIHTFNGNLTYDTTTDTWGAEAAPGGRTSPMAAVVGPTIYLIGGFGGSYYDIDTNEAYSTMPLYVFRKD